MYQVRPTPIWWIFVILLLWIVVGFMVTSAVKAETLVYGKRIILPITPSSQLIVSNFTYELFNTDGTIPMAETNFIRFIVVHPDGYTQWPDVDHTYPEGIHTSFSIDLPVLGAEMLDMADHMEIGDRDYLEHATLLIEAYDNPVTVRVYEATRRVCRGYR